MLPALRERSEYVPLPALPATGVPVAPAPGIPETIPAAVPPSGGMPAWLVFDQSDMALLLWVSVAALGIAFRWLRAKVGRAKVRGRVSGRLGLGRTPHDRSPTRSSFRPNLDRPPRDPAEDNRAARLGKCSGRGGGTELHGGLASAAADCVTDSECATAGMGSAGHLTPHITSHHLHLS